MGKVLHGSLDQDGEILHVTRMDSQVKYGVIARGESEFYVRLPKSHKDNIWDVAAGVLCLEEVGGKVTDTAGRPLDFTYGPNLPTVGILGARTDKLHQSLLGAYQQVTTNKAAYEQPKNRKQSASMLLKDCVCLVTGASRGIGRGIATELGAQGATVYLTGTSTSGDLTVEETARIVDEAGGVGIPVVCDHADDNQVQSLMDRIEKTHGKLDVLVNNAFQIPPGAPKSLMKPFWEQGSEAWDILMNVGLRSHFVATCKAIPLLRQSKSSNLARPLVVMISSFGGLSYTFNTPYGVAKAALDRMAKDMSFELGDSMCVTSVSL
jgi:NAD(P)-dependent dehydrogenase (short-subunit alcohol dehydrogenase family)